MSQKRIRNQFLSFTKEPLDGISVSMDQSDIFKWTGILIGPQHSVYEGGLFSFQVIFPKDYPFRAPQVNFLTPVYHPNIHEGEIYHRMMLCCGCQKGFVGSNWSPAKTIRKVLEVIYNEFKEPNSLGLCIDHHAIGRQFAKNRHQFDQMARVWTDTYAKM